MSTKPNPSPIVQPINAHAGALWAIGRGLRVLRVVPNGKVPYFDGTETIGPNGKPQYLVTTDRATVDRWFKTKPRLNYGIAMGRGLVALDCDSNKAGYFRDYLDLCHPATLEMRSANGGNHIVLRVDFDAGQSPLSGATSIDVRARGGYLVGPGSIVGGKRYTITDDSPIATCPPAIAARISRRDAKPDKPAAPLCEPDTAAAMADAWALVARTKPASEGERNRTAYTLAGKLKRLGVSLETCVDMVLHWNQGNSPPSPEDELRKTVASSYDNGDWRIGADRPEGEFEDVSASVDAILNPDTGLVVQRGDQIEMRAIEWLWPNRFALGKCSILAGEGGKGKTTVLIGMAATVTVGGNWPAGEGKAVRGSVLYFSTEDDPEDTIVPRLTAAGADLARVHIVKAVKRADGKQRSFHLQEDLSRLEAHMRLVADVRLIVFDPISAYFGRTDTYRNSEVRAVLGPLAEMAARHRVCIVGNSHFTKSGAGNANMRVLDSVAITAQARSVHVVTDDCEGVPGKRLFLPSKANIGPDVTGLRFSIEAVPVAPGIEGTRVVWEDGDVKVTADEAVAFSKNDKGPSALDSATKWLRDFLADGAKPADDVKDHGVNSGLHSWATLRRAADRLKVVSTKSGMDSGWVWTLPTDIRLEFEDITKDNGAS